MKQLLTITLSLVFLSCGENNESLRSDLLTSSIWTIEKGSIDGFSRMTDKYKFLPDGTCLLVAGDTEIHGKWSWVMNDEIYIKPEATVVNGQKTKVEGHGICIKIVELNGKLFRTLEKVEIFSWTSGLIKERKYTASSLK